MIAARERLGLSQRALAEQSGVSMGFIMRCEKLTYPKAEFSEKLSILARFLGIPEDDIIPIDLVGETIRTKYIQRLNINAERLLETKAAFDDRNILPAPVDDLGELEVLNNVREVLPKILQTLTFREREILKLRFGIGQEFAYTLEEVARIFKVTRERVKMVEAKAIRKLQHPKRKLVLAKAAGLGD
jgi:RNA polymerase sigma factor (sigma-70 family)